MTVDDSTSPDLASAGISVDELVRALGDNVTRAIDAAADETTRVRSLDVYPGSADQGVDLVIAVGVRPDEWPEVIAGCADRGACVLIADRLPREAQPMIRAAADEAGLCLLERSPDLPWLELADSIRDLILQSGFGDIRGSGVAVEGLAGLAESLAEMLGGPVIIEDAKFRVLSYSSSTDQVDRGRDIAILGRRIPDEWLRHLDSLGVIDTLLGTDEVVAVEDGPFEARRRLLCSIRAERFLLGILWVAEGDTPLPVDVYERMASAARAAAPFLLRHQEAGFRGRSTQDGQVRLLLDQGTMAHSAAEEYGLAPAARHVVFGLRTSPDVLLSNLDRNRVVESVQMYCQSYRWRAATTSIGHTVYCVLALDAHTADHRIRDFAAAMGDHIGRVLLGRSVHVALSRSVRGLTDIPAARNQVDRVFDTSAAADGVTIVSYDDAVARIALSDVSHFVTTAGISHPKLDLLRTEDRDSGSVYVATLQAYLTAFGNVVAASHQLNVHVTTLRYRLKRIQSISGLDLADPSERLLCELLLRP